MSDIPFGSLLEYPLRSGVTVAKEARGSGIRMINMGELFRYPRLRDVEMARVVIDASDTDRHLVRAGDLLFARRSLTAEGAGKCSIVLETSEPTTWESSILRARVDPNLAEPEYYFYFFSSSVGRSRMATIVEQVAAAGVRSSDLARLPVPNPGLDKQKSIVAVLRALDDKIAANDRVADSARRLAHAIFEASRVAGDVTRVAISEVASVVSRGITPRYTDDIRATLVLNQRCIRDGQISLLPARRTSSDKVPIAKFLQRRDVLVNSTGVGTLGRVALWDDDEKCTVDSHVTIIRFDEGKVDPVCAGFAVLNAQSLIEAMGEGSTGQTELSRTKLGALRLLMPSLRESLTLRPKLDALEERRRNAIVECSTLAALRDTLLPKLMSGEIRVRDAENVVEEAL